jgi:hypothetical protein
MARSSASTTQHQELAALIADRDRYREWLQKLAAQKGAIADSAFTRVQLDYHARLKDTYRQLGARLDGMRALLDTHRSELRNARIHLQEKTDELAEAELRYRVGEYDDGRWQQIQRTVTGQIEAAERRHGELESQVAGLEETLAEIESAAGGADDFDDAAFVRALVGGTPADEPLPGAPSGDAPAADSAEAPAVGSGDAPASTPPAAEESMAPAAEEEMAPAAEEEMAPAAAVPPPADRGALTEAEPQAAGTGAAAEAGGAAGPPAAASEAGTAADEEAEQETPPVAEPAGGKPAGGRGRGDESRGSARSAAGEAPPKHPRKAGAPQPRRQVQCPNCGVFNIAGTRFCEACGAAL